MMTMRKTRTVMDPLVILFGTIGTAMVSRTRAKQVSLASVSGFIVETMSIKRKQMGKGSMSLTISVPDTIPLS